MFGVSSISTTRPNASAVAREQRQEGPYATGDGGADDHQQTEADFDDAEKWAVGKRPDDVLGRVNVGGVESGAGHRGNAQDAGADPDDQPDDLERAPARHRCAGGASFGDVAVIDRCG